ncbi:mechanosensitive ion channel [Psychrosphaera sp. B3R10]|uniref:Small-conductance mechanosensitive channel n=1 Tax=Psychrosphaera algicola TaxID=3023714 RepID=A0ABT5FHM3_9GAMM|nr:MULTISPECIES: mechanosensitive ion channel domain-containing protein [unclassified Psychrosphaera]MBU2880435.1 mechanosensitive ion channel [Psychrosphaera sp. I2R16]MBU2991464.1 mechanosensitive ion channel [Psychrosphaera sp. B3R10]MDC2890699.1 mechanosensitive ion channel [Psychrosphaera sp. G1-22]MDO6719356.1 mechanosensitive ion channel [Psychrosphaera sp. 1_MG-2023]
MEQVVNWFSNNSDQIVESGIQLAYAIAIFIVGKMIARAISGLLEKALKKKNVDKAVSGFLGSLVYALVLVAVVLMALSQIGVQTTSFIAILGAAGLAIGLALKDSLSNFASGVLIIILKPFKAGDFVEAAGVAGSIVKIEIFSTIFKTGDNKVVIVPNSTITGGAIVNYSREATRRVDMVIGVSYDADLKVTKKLLTDIVTSHEKVLADPAPTIAVAELADSSVNFVVRPWTNTADFWTVKFDLTEQIKIALDEAEIGIPYPQMDVHVHKND